MSVASILADASCAALLGYLGVLVGLHLRPSDYRPLTHAVSDYAVGPTRPWATAAAALNGAGALALAGAFARGLAPFPFKAAAVALLLALGAGRLAIVAFPTDLAGARRTRVGLIHYALAIANFGLAYTIIDNATPYLAGLAAWQPVAPALTALAAVATVALVALVAALLIRPLRRVFGLCERAFLATVALWFVLCGAALAGLAR